MEAQTKSGYNRTLKIRVMQQQYTQEELEQLWPAFEEKLRSVLFAEGESADYVTKDLNLPTSLPDYPFRLQWKSDSPLLLSSDGRILEDGLQEADKNRKGVPVVLEAEVSCQDYEKTISIPVRVYKKSLTQEEIFWENVEASIEAWNVKSATKEYQQLPRTVDEQQLSYREKGQGSWLFLLLCGLLAALLTAKHFDDELFVRVKKRDEQLERDYPHLVNRFVMYYSAGLTIKNIWNRICRDYRERKKITGISYAYEEMLRAEHNMQDGVGEKEAYSEFASSIGLTKYRNLIALLQQTLQSGGQDIRMQLNEQLREAFSEQKRRARILGEKAGTKMLMPMFLMLAVVLVVILFPAFLSF